MRKRHIPSAALLIIIVIMVSVFTPHLIEFEEVSLLVTVIGLIFGLLAGFKISQSYERVQTLRNAVAEEVSSFYNLVSIFSKLPEKTSLIIPPNSPKIFPNAETLLVI